MKNLRDNRAASIGFGVKLSLSDRNLRKFVFSLQTADRIYRRCSSNWISMPSGSWKYEKLTAGLGETGPRTRG
jgi:hypothetical protein